MNAAPRTRTCHVGDRGSGHPVRVAEAVQAGPPEDAVYRRAAVEVNEAAYTDGPLHAGGQPGRG
jgi:hypothetical protein